MQKMWRAAVFLLAVTTCAVPQVSYPFNAQLPPVARIGESYSFQFASTTFEPESENLQYSLAGNPSWLSLNGATRTLWGTPGASDVGSISFNIIAAGSAGAVANMQSTLVIVGPGGPTFGIDISESLSQSGKLSGSASLTFLPSKTFDIKFPSDTFTDGGKNLSYYATLSDHTPLPSWIAFDSGHLHFYGTTPQPGSSPQAFDILLIASDVVGFAGSSISFTLVISNHMLLFNPWRQTINTAKGSAISFTSLRNQLTLDGGEIADGDLQSATAQLPSWLSFDPHTFAVTGTPPSGLMSQDISVVANDRFGDVANTTIRFAFVSPMFNGEVGQLNATVGEDFNYTLSRSLLSQEGEIVSMDFANAGQWLSFDSSALTIHGKIPEGTVPQDIEATLTASSLQDRDTNDSQTFRIHVTATEAQTTIVVTTITSSTAITESASPTTANGATTETQTKSKKKIPRRTSIIVGAVIGGVILPLIVIILAILCCRRFRRSRTAPKSPTKQDISRPIIQSNKWEDFDRSHIRDLEKEFKELDERTVEHPPQIELELPLKSPKRNKASQSVVSSIADGEAKILEEFNHSSWGYNEEMGHTHKPHDSMKLPTEMARILRGISQDSNSLTKQRPRTTTVYRDSYRSVGLPLNRRLTGLGHGRNTYSSSRSRDSWSAFQRPRECASFSSYRTRSTSMLSTAPSAFPWPPTAHHTTQFVSSADKRRTIRMGSGTGDSIPDHHTLDEHRQSYIRNRASNRSPFFGAASSRASSSSYKSPVLPLDLRFVELPPSTTTADLRPSESIFNREKKEFPDGLRTHSGSAALALVSANNEFPRSLRKHTVQRSLGKASLATSSAEPSLHMQKKWDRPSSWRHGFAEGYPRPVTSRSNTRESLRGHSIKGSLSSLR